MTDVKVTVDVILQECVFPRCVFSPADAMYCARFSERLQSMDTPFFRSIFYYDRVLKDITQLVVCCTEYEAGRLGKFLNETLEQLLKWKSDKAGGSLRTLS
jgi:THO complex subunit 2